MAVEIRCVPLDDVGFCEAVARALADLPDLSTPALRIASRRRLDAIRGLYPRAEIRVGERRGRENCIVFAFRDGPPPSAAAL